MLERTAEVVVAQAGDRSKVCQGQPIIEMGLDVVLHALEPLARQSDRRLEPDRYWITASERLGSDRPVTSWNDGSNGQKL
jgi:hypothetical protein